MLNIQDNKMFPSEDTLANMASQHPLGLRKTATSAESPAPRQVFPAWNVVEDAKKEASREFQLASQKAQEKTGKIEPWTGKYYAACTFGGLLACVYHLVLLLL